MWLPDPKELQDIKDEEIPQLLAHLNSLQGILTSRLLKNGTPEQKSPEKDRLLKIGEAAERLGCTKDWIYRRTDRLPFVVRLGNQVRFSEKGIEKFIKQRKNG